METFLDLKIPQWLKDSLAEMGYIKPTPIQEQAIPFILAGKDVLASAQTGTGKTAAFLIPLLNHLSENKNATAIVLAPTRELATQVELVAKNMLKNYKPIKTVLLIGGESITRQLQQLRYKPRVIIGTPGRVNDHLSRRSLNLNQASFIVLDETDRMLDMGFGIQIDNILEHVAEERQTALFSATLPRGIQKLASNYLKEYERVSSGELNAIATNITQESIETRDKFTTLMQILSENTGATIIFVRTQRMAEWLTDKLYDNNIKVDALHGGLKQSRRNSIVKAYRDNKFRVLAATDVASRGLDIPHIELVVNYDLPENAEDYVHRIGRTARAEKSGKAISFIGNGDKGKWHTIQRFIGATTGKSEDDTTESTYRGSNNRNRSFKGTKDRDFSNSRRAPSGGQNRFGSNAHRGGFAEGRPSRGGEGRYEGRRDNSNSGTVHLLGKRSSEQTYEDRRNTHVSTTPYPRSYEGRRDFNPRTEIPRKSNFDPLKDANSYMSSPSYSEKPKGNFRRGSNSKGDFKGSPPRNLKRKEN